MDILAHCRIYPLSQFYHPEVRLLKLPDAPLTKDPKNQTDNTKIRSLHLIEHDFKISAVKRRFLMENLPSEQGKILVIDLISVWYNTLIDPNVKDKIYYMNSSSILTTEGLINFLVQLNDKPKVALGRCHDEFLAKQHDDQLCGIIIDNLSYLKNTDAKSMNLLLKMLKILSKTFGCWIMTVSYGIEYYQGIEMSFNLRGGSKSNYPTMIPMGYLNDMDAIMLRETVTSMRQLK